jgi:hypothetical protein
MPDRMDDIYARLRPAPETPPDEMCSCADGKLVKLMVALGSNPIHCLDCNLEVDPGALPLPQEMVDAVAHWAATAGAIEWLELDSGPYELWAQGELLDPQSPVNREGLELRRRLDNVRHCYYVFFQRMGDNGFVVPDSCPTYLGSLDTYLGGIFPQRICEACGIVLVNA